MAKSRRNDMLIPFLAVLSDAVAIFLSFYTSYILRFESFLVEFIPVTKGHPPLEAYMLACMFVAPVWLIMFNGGKVYRPRRDADLSNEFFSVVRQISIGMLIVFSIAFFYRSFSYSRIVFFFLWLTAILFIFMGRMLVFAYERRLYKSGRELRNLLIVGSSTAAQEIALRVSQHPATGYRLCGYLSREGERIESVSVPRLGWLSELPGIVDSERIETIIVCLPAGESPMLSDLLTALEGKSIQILIHPDVIGVRPTRLRVMEMFSEHLVTVKDNPMTTWARISKRAFDVVLSFFVLLLFAPFAAMISLAIWLESGRPVLYKQVRVGLGGDEFELYKFRTMRIDAETDSGPTWTKRGDPRVIRVGRLLRRFSLDEMPQFINVIRGEMSVVGPRPERPEFVRQFRRYIPKYLERHRLKTGLTGWAQVNGLRGEVPISERTKYDLYYIENWSLKLDIRIIFKTVYAVLFGKDAY